MSKTLKEYQEEIDHIVIVEQRSGYWAPLSILARITEEVGEVARLLNHLYGSKPKKDTEEKQELDEEIADVMYGLICLANSEQIDLDHAMQKVLNKSRTRDIDRFRKSD